MLADVSEPLILADGTRIDPDKGTVIKDGARKFVEVPSPTEAQKIIARTRMTVAELPAPPEQLTGVALVAFYTLFGLSDMDISVAVQGRLTVEQIKRIRDLDPYKAFMDNARANIIETATEDVRALFQSNARGAAEKVLDAVNSDNDVLAFKAAQDVLDRAGHRPADIVEHRHKMEDALNIVITRKDDDHTSLPVIDVTPAVVGDDE